MKRWLIVAGTVVLAAVITGCVSTTGRDDPVGEWQKDRFAADDISALKAQNKLAGPESVAVRSTMASPKFANMINGFDVPLAEMYVYYVRAVDEMYAKSEGRIVFQDIVDAMTDNKSTFETEIAKLDPADKKLLDEYLAYAEGKKTDEKMLERIVKDAAKLTLASAELADLIMRIKNDPQFAAYAGLDLIRQGGALAADSKAIGDQIASAVKGNQLLSALVEQDKKAREYALKLKK